MNNFLQLQDEEIQQFVRERQDLVRGVVEKRVKASHFIADVVELFFPRLGDTLTVMLGGDVIESDPEYFLFNDDDKNWDGKDNPTPPSGPGDRDEIIR